LILDRFDIVLFAITLSFEFVIGAARPDDHATDLHGRPSEPLLRSPLASQIPLHLLSEVELRTAKPAVPSKVRAEQQMAPERLEIARYLMGSLATGIPLSPRQD
jgi:hypothetical protein